MSHAQAQELLGAYAVDAVDPDEAAAIEAHLDECARCRAELAEMREVAATLAQTGGDAPAGLWDRIAASLDDNPPPLRLEVQRERRRTRRPWLLAVAAVAAAVVIMVLGVSVVSLRNDVDDLREAASQPSAQIAQAAERAKNESGARVATLTGDTGASAATVVRPNGQGFLIADTMPILDDQIYELWGALPSGEVTSLGTIPGPGTYAFTADPNVEQILITVEDKPVPAPTTMPIVGGTLS